jgi:hypothetical protein
MLVNATVIELARSPNACSANAFTRVSSSVIAVVVIVFPPVLIPIIPLSPS